MWDYISPCVAVCSLFVKQLKDFLHPDQPTLAGPICLYSRSWFSISNNGFRCGVLPFFRWPLCRNVKYAFDISRCSESRRWSHRWAGQGPGLLCCRPDDNFWMNGPIRCYDYVSRVQKLRKYGAHIQTRLGLSIRPRWPVPEHFLWACEQKCSRW